MANPQHVTLVADTVATVTLSAPAPATVEIVNVDGSAEVYVSVDGTDPTVSGDGFWVLPAAIGFLQLDPRATGSGTATVKLISSGTPKVSVGVIA